MPRMKLNALHLTQLLQPRAEGVDKERVQRYAADLERGDAFPPLVAYRISDRSFPKPALVAGFHTYDALALAGRDEHEVDVREGTFADALLAAWLSNRTHGASYTNADKRKITETALKLWRADSARSIADRIRVSHDYVSKIRKELVAAGTLEPEAKVKGKDGRSQSRGKKSSNAGDTQVSSDDTCLKPKSERDETSADAGAPEPDPVDPADDEPEEQPAPPFEPPAPFLKDGLGAVIPRGLADTFGDPMLADAIARIDAAHKELVSLEQHVVRTLARKGEFWPYALFGECAKSLRAAADRAAEASAQLFAGVPFCVCPKCKGDGCQDCRNSGAWPRHRYDNRAQYGDAA